jgi:hypothetical protein
MNVNDQSPKSDNQQFSTVWIAGQDRATSIWKYLVYDDKGNLSVTPASVIFKGAFQSQEIPLSTVRKIEIRKQAWAWALSACFVGLACVFCILDGLTTGQMSGALFSVLVLVGFFVLMGKSVADSYSVPWVVLTYSDKGHSHELWITVATLSDGDSTRKETFRIRDVISAHTNIHSLPSRRSRSEDCTLQA